MATSSYYKVESGIQLLARLTKKPTIRNVYPQLFQCELKPGEIIELLISKNTPQGLLLTDLISIALLPKDFGGTETGILVFSCCGNLNYVTLMNCMKEKIRLYNKTLSDKQIDAITEKQMVNLFVVEIYDTTQYYTTICNLENLLLEHPNINIVLFDTVTAFYWSEQGFKIMKMDTYLKKILSKIKSATKQHNVIVFYSKPDYFISSKDVQEISETLYEFPEGVNYSISISHDKGNIYEVNLNSHNMKQKKCFCVNDQIITWI